MLKLLALAVIVGLCKGQVSIKYPTNNPCILVDIEASFHMVWTDPEGKQTPIPDFTFDNNPPPAGLCAKDTNNADFVKSWNDGGTFMFLFVKSGEKVSYDWEMKYSPDSVYKNGQSGVVSHTGTLGIGSAETAYACAHVPVVNDTQSRTDKNKYQLVITIKSLKAQAFGVTDGKYSQEGRCDADNDLTSPEPKETTEPTTEPDSPSTEKETTAPTTETTPATETSPTTEPSPGTETSPAPETSPVTETSPSTETSPVTETSPAPETSPATETSPSTETTPTETPMTTEPANDTTAPSTPTTKPTTKPTPAPTPAPTPGQHPKQIFTVSDGAQQCVLMTGEFLFTLVYPKKDKSNGSVDVGVQEVTSVKGNCNNTDGENQVIVMFYDDWEMELTISKKSASIMLGADDSNKYYWSHLNLKYDYATKLGGKDVFPDYESNVTAQTLNVTLPAGTYEASTDGSYLCNSNENIDLGTGNKLQTWNLQYDAFNTQNHTTFTDKNLTECSADSKTSSVVPIAVGAALAGLVVIVLIAYLIGRRRNRKGYESV